MQLLHDVLKRYRYSPIFCQLERINCNHEQEYKVSELRVGSVRLCWIEAFVELEIAENISAVARKLGVNQSTVSRHIQALEAWLGKKLIAPGAVNDPDDLRVSVGLTEDGLQFIDLAKKFVDELNGFRTHEAKCEENLDLMGKMVAKMQANLYSKNPTKTAVLAKSKIETLCLLYEALEGSQKLEELEVLHRRMRDFFATFEREVISENRRIAHQKQKRNEHRGIDPWKLKIPKQNGK